MGHSAIYAQLSRRSLDAKGPLLPILEAIRWIPQITPPELPPSEERPFFFEPQLVEYYPELDKAWALFEKSVAGIRDDCAERGLEFLTFDIPDLNGIWDKQWEKAMNESGSKHAYKRFKSNGLLEKMLTRLNIPHVSLLPKFQAFPNAQTLYIIPDAHLNPNGIRFVAEILRDRLVKDTLPRKGIHFKQENPSQN
jgi:hypothetical protein